MEAAPLDRVHKTVMGEIPPDVMQVLVDDELWVGGVSQKRLSHTVRQLHNNYTRSKPYRALFHAALNHVGKPEIDCLVTGLPVSQYFDGEKREELRTQLMGSHEVAPGVTVDVGQVVIMPQPVGGYFHYLDNLKDPSVVTDGVVAIVDSGFFSFDWAVFEKGDLLEEHSGTTLSAASSVIEQMQKAITREHKLSRKVSMELLEQNIREGKDKLYLGKKRTSIDVAIKEASTTVASEAFSALMLSIREQADEFNELHIVGGGASMYLDSAKSLFPNVNISITNEPVLANNIHISAWSGSIE